MAFCLWITGLPGCGKSTIASELEEILSQAGMESLILNLDRIRTILTPEPKYTEEERGIVYRALVLMAQLLVEQGRKNVVIDATGNRREYRDLARSLIPEFAEVHVSCPLETAMERETGRRGGFVRSRLYKDAAEGKLTGGLPGFTTTYEEPADPEVTVDSVSLSPRQAASRIADYVRSRWGG